MVFRCNMKKFMLFVLFPVLFFCSFFLMRPKMSKESKAVHQIVREISSIYTKKYNMRYSGISLAAPGGIYRDIGVCFDYQGYLTKDEARVILLEIADALLEKINDNTILKPHLKNYPFTGNNITVDIFLVSPEGKRIYYPDIKIISLYGDKLRYKYDSPETESQGVYYLKETETIEEARQIVNQQQNTN